MAKKMNWSIALSCLVALGVAAILIITPVKRGMFFREDYLPFFTKASWFFIAVAVILVIQRHNIWQPMPDLALLAVVALYGLTILWAKNKGAAIDGALKYCVYLGVFLSAKYASKERVSNTLLRWSIVASGVVAAMVGLLSAAGVISYKDAVVGGRIFGSFQYPNALAAYEMFVCFILLHAWYETEKLKQPWARWLGQVLFSLSGFIVLLVIVLSYSRATWIIFAAALVGYFAMLPPEARGGIFLRFTTALVPVLIVNVPMAAAIPAKEHAVVQKYMLTGAAICLGAEIARALLTSLAQSRPGKPKASTHTSTSNRADRSPGPQVRKAKGKKGKTRQADKPKQPRKAPEKGARLDSQESPGAGSRRGSALSRVPAILAVVLVAALVLGFTTEAGQEILAKVVPASVISRFKSITLSDRSLVTRFIASKDAFSIARGNPFGTGAGGWDALYHKYQSTLYWFTETHNHFAQVLVETGFPGLLACAAFWIYAIWVALRAWRLARLAAKSVPEISAGLEVSELVSTTFAVLALVAHSSADFELSIPAIAMALFAATGSLLGSSGAVLSLDCLDNVTIAAGKTKESKTTWRFRTDIQLLQSRYFFDALSLIILAVIIIVPANKYYKGMIYGSVAVQEFYKGNEQGGIDFMHEAMKIDPHTSSYALDIAASYVRQYEKDYNPRTATMAKLYLLIARERSPHSLEDRTYESQMLSALGFHDEAADVTYELTEMIPLDIRFYELLAADAKEAMMVHGASILSQGIQDQSRQKHTDAARRYADLIKDIPARLEEQKARITGIYEQNWSPKQLDVTQPIALALGQVHFLEGNFEACVENLTLAAKKADLKNQAGTWLRALAMATQTNVALPEGAKPDEGQAQAAADMYGLLSQ